MCQSVQLKWGDISSLWCSYLDILHIIMVKSKLFNLKKGHHSFLIIAKDFIDLTFSSLQYCHFSIFCSFWRWTYYQYHFRQLELSQAARIPCDCCSKAAWAANTVQLSGHEIPEKEMKLIWIFLLLNFWIWQSDSK